MTVTTNCARAVAAKSYGRPQGFCRLVLFCLFLIVAHACLAAPAQGGISPHPQLGEPSAMFVPLGDLPGGTFFSQPYDLSADGLVVVGESEGSNGRQAFRWTFGEGMVALGDGLRRSRATGVSADGSIVVGSGTVNAPEAFRWTAEEGIVGLGDIPGGEFGSAAVAVSNDGAVVVGYGWGEVASIEAARWTADAGMIGLGFLSNPFFPESVASSISADGSVIVGYSFGFRDMQAVRWTEHGGIESLGELPGGALLSEATAVSADGSIIVGYAWDLGGMSHAFRWTPETGMVSLGDAPGEFTFNIAFDVSADGSVIVGSYHSSSAVGAAVWYGDSGPWDIKAMLADVGVDLTGWFLDRATAVSADGRTIVGWGTNPSGFREAWLARLPIPEPAGRAAWLWAVFGGAIRFRQRRGRTLGDLPVCA